MKLHIDPHEEEDYRDFADFKFKLNRVHVILFLIALAVGIVWHFGFGWGTINIADEVMK